MKVEEVVLPGVGRKYTIRSMQGASKPVVSTETFTRDLIWPRLNCVRMVCRSALGVSPVTISHEMA